MELLLFMVIAVVLLLVARRNGAFKSDYESERYRDGGSRR